jgi:hypothetical protein
MEVRVATREQLGTDATSHRDPASESESYSQPIPSLSRSRWPP